MKGNHSQRRFIRLKRFNRRATAFLPAALWGLLLSARGAVGQDLGQRSLQKLIDCPSAGGPESGSYDFELRAYPDGGVLAGFTVGLFSRLSLGLFHGGTGIIGYGKPDWNPQPGISAACRLMNESLLLPALAIGYTDQGYGAWNDSTDRYQFKAKGFYAVLGKNFIWRGLGENGLHFGVNMNPAEGDEKQLDYFAALDFRPAQPVALIAEYTGALNDDKGDEGYGEGRGYLNAGLRLSFAERLALDLNLRDILNNQMKKFRGGESIGREIRISYVERF